MAPGYHGKISSNLSHLFKRDLEVTGGSGEALGSLHVQVGDQDGLLTGTRWEPMSWEDARVVSIHCSSLQTVTHRCLFIPLGTEDKTVNESVPLQSFWFSPHRRGSPSPCMSVWDLQEADTEIKLKMQRSFFLVTKPTKDKRGGGLGVGRESQSDSCARRRERKEEWVGRSSDFSATLRKSHLATDYLLEESPYWAEIAGF